MSYCRFSSDNGQCDLYCYESNEGFVTHVACYRQRAWKRLFHFLTDKRMKIPGIAYRPRLTRFYLFGFPRWLTHKRLGLPSDGKMFIDESESLMFERIVGLYIEGYNIPESLLDEATKPSA